MEITSTSFLAIVIAVSVVVLAFSIFAVPHIISRHPAHWKYVIQTLAIVLTSLLLFASVAAILNAQNSWFPSWKSLEGDPADQNITQQNFGQPTPNLSSSTEHPEAEHPSELQANPYQNPDFGKNIPQDTSDGAYVTATVAGAKSGETHEVLLWLPASYFENPNRFYPVIMGFPGYPGSPQSYQGDLNFADLLKDAVAENSIREAIFVVGNVMPTGHDTECVDGTQGDNPPKTETYISQDLVAWIKDNLRTINSPEAWATTGYSAGGWCASMLAVRHPDIFGAAMNQSGYFAPVYSDNQQWNDPQDPRYLLAERVKQDKPDIHIFFYASEDDPLSMEGYRTFAHAVSEPTSLTVNTIPIGGHRAVEWQQGIRLGLQNLGKTLPYFAPVQ